MNLAEAIASLRHGDFVRVKLTGDRIVQGEVRREGDSFVAVGDMLLIRRDHPNDVITGLHILRRAVRVTSFSDQAITDHYDHAYDLGYLRGYDDGREDGREEIDIRVSIPLRVTTHEAEASIRELMDTGAELWIALYALPKKDGER